MTQSPGTVSRILWHFTGGPKWNSKALKQYKRLKPRKQAYGNLKAIIKTRELRVGQYVEVAKLVSPELKFSKRTRRLVGVENKPVTSTSAPICCLADIPIAHLAYHADRYERFAIGFHRDAVVEHFNPVFYTLQNTRIIQSIYNGFTALADVDVGILRSEASYLKRLASDRAAAEDSHSLIEYEALTIAHNVKRAERSFKLFLAFVKTLQEDQFGSIYCEREWRSLSTYSFTPDECVAMIVLPRDGGYFDRFVRRDAQAIGLSRSIPVVP